LLPRRQFAEWSMDFGFADASVLDAIRQENHRAEWTLSSRQRQALLSSFAGTKCRSIGK